MKPITHSHFNQITGGTDFSYSLYLSTPIDQPGAMLYQMSGSGEHHYSFYGYQEQSSFPGIEPQGPRPGSHYRCDTRLAFPAEAMVKINLIPTLPGDSRYTIQVQSTLPAIYCIG